ncbi:type II toxin-antitoxin system RelE/ParE family toxin [Niveispirillum sp. SYP-B3756]|uniref:type II toxin-antitoxin system RelE family toxin n=1 Tax=unclassified Niveispirillum TaxID=2649257 RepID=UPI0012925E4E|nr:MULTISPECIES: type II toxin-antitoxin system RelE/ParE family toxin [unclassified Niveispirillum]MDG5495412.1 type II toxin-antitoxin system RelE/ParE family toxin [Niveispirillum sp. BGYR6]MQP64095.1 type II toxin-antitoxin system RelE/ParE family toxin [Niveispirillum sp. SYP-B3756]
MKLALSKAALKGLSKMPPKARTSMMEKLETVAASPFASHPFDVKALTGVKDMYRIRQGDWRAVYELVRIDDIMMVVIVDIRGEVYK